MTIENAESDPREAFDLIAAIFSRMDRMLLKITVTRYTKRNRFAIIILLRETSEQCARILYIPSTANPPAPIMFPPTLPQHDGASAQDFPKPEHLDLAHIQDTDVQAQIFAIFYKLALMRNGSLSAIKVTDHRINLQLGSRPVRSIPYRQSLAMREYTRAESDKKLTAGVTEPAIRERASLVVFVSKKDGTLRLCVGYRRLNTKTLSETYLLFQIEDCIGFLGDAVVLSTLDCSFS